MVRLAWPVESGLRLVQRERARVAVVDPEGVTAAEVVVAAAVTAPAEVIVEDDSASGGTVAVGYADHTDSEAPDATIIAAQHSTEPADPCVDGTGTGGDCGPEMSTALEVPPSECAPGADAHPVTGTAYLNWHSNSNCGTNVRSQALTGQLQIRKAVLVFRYWARVDGAKRVYSGGGNKQMSNRVMPKVRCGRYRGYTVVNWTYHDSFPKQLPARTHSARSASFTHGC